MSEKPATDGGEEKEEEGEKLAEGDARETQKTVDGSDQQEGGDCGDQKQGQRTTDGASDRKEKRPKEDQEEKTEKENEPVETGGENREKDIQNGKKKKKEKKSDEEDGGGGKGGRSGSGGFEIIAIKEKHGQMRKAVPVMPMPLAVVLCLVNVLLPGIGTLVSAFVVFCGGKTEYESKGKAFGLNVVAAVLQLVTLPIIVGWIWSIVWGVTFVTSAMSKEAATKDGGAQAPPPEHV